ncbi:hypothetical protein BaRGS_00002525 [Batillaria attramentaria]|uniref:Uncharacterized protein n=1 Tax=Batillaria attramentaria TaxID=370345 RepID=A0ABD0M4S3_9CAEN
MCKQFSVTIPSALDLLEDAELRTDLQTGTILKKTERSTSLHAPVPKPIHLVRDQTARGDIATAPAPDAGHGEWAWPGSALHFRSTIDGVCEEPFERPSRKPCLEGFQQSSG